VVQYIQSLTIVSSQIIAYKNTVYVTDAMDRLNHVGT